jgi:hypothetical protein
MVADYHYDLVIKPIQPLSSLSINNKLTKYTILIINRIKHVKGDTPLFGSWSLFVSSMCIALTRIKNVCYSVFVDKTPFLVMSCF